MNRLFLVALLGFLIIPRSAAATHLPVAPQRHAPGKAGGWIAADANAHHAWLYVSEAAAITAYDLQRTSYPQVLRITTGISTPGGIALDAKGSLYVPNENAGTVTVYEPGATTPTLTLSGTQAPESVAVDPEGNVFVCNRGSSPGVSVYAPGQTQPSRRITSDLLRVPSQVALAADGTLYVTDNGNGVLTLAPGSQTLHQVPLQGLPQTPSGFAVDQATGYFYLSGSTEPPDFFSFYPAGQLKPKKTREVAYGGLDFLEVGVLHKRTVVFAPNSQGSFIDAFALDLKGKPTTIPIESGAIAVSVAYKAPSVP